MIQLEESPLFLLQTSDFIPIWYNNESGIPLIFSLLSILHLHIAKVVQTTEYESCSHKHG